MVTGPNDVRAEQHCPICNKKMRTDHIVRHLWNHRYEMPALMLDHTIEYNKKYKHPCLFRKRTSPADTKNSAFAYCIVCRKGTCSETVLGTTGIDYFLKTYEKIHKSCIEQYATVENIMLKKPREVKKHPPKAQGAVTEPAPAERNIITIVGNTGISISAENVKLMEDYQAPTCPEDLKDYVPESPDENINDIVVSSKRKDVKLTNANKKIMELEEAIKMEREKYNVLYEAHGELQDNYDYLEKKIYIK